jgi:hypothetical protein
LRGRNIPPSSGRPVAGAYSRADASQRIAPDRIEGAGKPAGGDEGRLPEHFVALTTNKFLASIPPHLSGPPRALHRTDDDRAKSIALLEEFFGSSIDEGCGQPINHLFAQPKKV